VPAGHDELEVLAPRPAEQGDALGRAPGLTVGVIAKLADEARVPVGVDDAPENIVDDALLLLREVVAVDVVRRDLPVVGDLL
jgi:hypothetical protein